MRPGGAPGAIRRMRPVIRRGILGGPLPLLLGLLAGCAEAPTGMPPAAPSAPAPGARPHRTGAPPEAPPETPAGQAACARLTVSATHRGVRDPESGLRSAHLRVSSAADGARITLVEPYYGGVHDDLLSNITVIPSNSRPLAFISDLSPRVTADSHDDELTISFLGPLELLVDAGGCEPMRVRCDATACTVE